MSLSPYFPELILREGFFFFFDGGSHSFREMPYSFPPPTGRENYKTNQIT